MEGLADGAPLARGTRFSNKMMQHVCDDNATKRSGKHLGSISEKSKRRFFYYRRLKLGFPAFFSGLVYPSLLNHIHIIIFGPLVHTCKEQPWLKFKGCNFGTFINIYPQSLKKISL